MDVSPWEVVCKPTKQLQRLAGAWIHTKLMMGEGDADDDGENDDDDDDDDDGDSEGTCENKLLPGVPFCFVNISFGTHPIC